MKILVADDDLTTRILLSGLLPKWGHEACCVADGNEAWAALQKPEAPRLAILDWSMPGADGPDLCRRLRRQHVADITSEV